MVKQVEKPKTKEGEAPLGVRTRSQTLRLNKLNESSVDDIHVEVDKCYLKLRSRRVERLPAPSVATKRRNGSRKRKEVTSRDEKKEEEAPPSVELGGTERTSTERVPANSFGAASRFTNAKEFDNFFDRWEKFSKKYNYDSINDKPLSGRFEWEEIKP